MARNKENSSSFLSVFTSIIYISFRKRKYVVAAQIEREYILI